MALRCRIVTPDRAILDAEASAVVLPASDGEMGVWPKHAALLALLGAGTLRVTTAEGPRAFAVREGFAEVGPDHVVVAAVEVEDGRALDPDACTAEYDRARQPAGRGADRAAHARSVAWARARLQAARAARTGGQGMAGGHGAGAH